MVRWLKVFYRRMERMIQSDVHNNTRMYHPADMFPAPPQMLRGTRKNEQSISPNLPYLQDDPHTMIQEVRDQAEEAKGPKNDDYVSPYEATPAPSSTPAPDDDYVSPYSRRRRSEIPMVVFMNTMHQTAPEARQPAETAPLYPETGLVVSKPLPSPYENLDLHNKSSWPEVHPNRAMDSMIPWEDAVALNRMGLSQRQIWPSTQAARRTKRGLFNFLGRAEHYLFGTAGPDQLKKINQEMLKMGKQNGMLARINLEFASKLNVTLRTVQQHDAQIKKLSELAITNFENLRAQINDFTASMRRTHATIDSIRSEVQDFLTAWEIASTQGSLSPAFIEPTRLLEILLEVQTHVSHLGLKLPMRPTLGNIHVYYGTIKVKPLLNEDNLTLVMSVPLVFKDGLMSLYSSRPFPYKFNNSDVFQFYKPETEYLAVNSKLTAHLLMTEADVAKCRTSEINVCSPMVAMHQGAASCSMALFLSDADRTKDLCEAYFIRRPQDRFVGFSHGTSWAFSLG